MSIELETIAESGKAPRTRIKDVKSAHSIYMAMRQADDASSLDRVKIQSMLDGEPPYSPNQLKALGQGYRANLNFGEASAALETALSAYSDLVNSVDKLVSVKTSFGDPSQRLEWENIISEEFHRTVTDWDEFFYKQQMLAHQFVAYGVGLAFFEDSRNWQWNVCGMKDFKVPRGTPASDTKFEILTIERNFLAGELYQYIENPKIAAELGWNVEETRKTILLSTESGMATGREWERLQEELKNNDLIYSHARSKVIRAVHYFVQEFDGTVSHYIGTRTGNEADFLFKRPSRFKNANEAFVLFSYGIGSNGLLHSIRGLGYKLFPFIQLSNRLRNAVVDGAMLSSALMIQPATNTATEFYNQVNVVAPDMLKAGGTGSFDSFVATHLTIGTSMQIDMKGEFKFVPAVTGITAGAQFMRAVGEVLNVVTPEDLANAVRDAGGQFPVGQPQTKICPMLPEQRRVISMLAEAYGKWKDLKFTEKKKYMYFPLIAPQVAIAAMMDIGLVDHSVDLGKDKSSKISVAVSSIVSEWRDTADSSGVQLVFLDQKNRIGTKRIDEFLGHVGVQPFNSFGASQEGDEVDIPQSALSEEDRDSESDEKDSSPKRSTGPGAIYEALRARLIEAGIPAAQIASIDDVFSVVQIVRVTISM